jgi:hypothetical protein
LNTSCIDWRRFCYACMAGFLLSFFAFLFLQNCKVVGSGCCFSQYSLSLLCFSLLQCHCLVIYFTCLRLWSSSRYILVGIKKHCLKYVSVIVVKVQWNTFVESVTISYLPYFGTEAPKYGAYCVFRYISSVTPLATDVVIAKLLLEYQLHYTTFSYHLHGIQVTFSYCLHGIQVTFSCHLHGIQVSFSCHVHGIQEKIGPLRYNTLLMESSSNASVPL